MSFFLKPFKAGYGAVKKYVFGDTPPINCEKDMEIQGLGRRLKLGMLYDGPREKPVTNCTLWDRDILDEDTEIEKSYNSNFNVTTNDSLTDRFNSLQVGDELRLSFVSGLVHVSGSGEYLQERRQSYRCCRLILTFHVTTHSEKTLSARSEAQNLTTFISQEATHFVSGIKYGASAVFVFESTKQYSKNNTKILQAELEKFAEQFLSNSSTEGTNTPEIPSNYSTTSGTTKSGVRNDPTITTQSSKVPGDASESDNGSEDLNCSDPTVNDSTIPGNSLEVCGFDALNELKKFSCHCYSDFPIKNQPTSFEDAVELFKTLPKMLVNNFEQALPITAYLTSVLRLEGKTQSNCHSVSQPLITSATRLFEELYDANVRCNDALCLELCKTEPLVGAQLSTFKSYIDEGVAMVQRQLRSVLPDVRAGNKQENERDLVEILQAYKRSPLYSAAVKKFIAQCEREITEIYDVLKELQRNNVQRCSSDELISLSQTRGRELKPLLVLVINITAPTKNRYLKNVYQYVHQTADRDNGGITSTPYNEQMATHAIDLHCLRREVAKFTSFIKHNLTRNEYAVSFEYADNVHSETVSLIAIHKRKREYFHLPPSIADPPTVYETESTVVTLSWNLHSDNGDIDDFDVLFRVTGTKDWEYKKTKKITDNSFYVIELSQETEYEFAVQPKCPFGVGPMSRLASVTTQPKLSKSIVDKSKKLSVAKEYRGPPQYRPPMIEVYCDEKNKVRKFCVGPQALEIIKKKKKWDQVCKLKMTSEKVILILGATGSGKSTLINSLANYLFHVEWEDGYRFRLITSEDEGSKSSSKSQTEWVTAYSFPVLNDGQFPHAVTVVDTPGFMDTGGFGRDDALIQNIKQFFSAKGSAGIAHLNAVGIVTQAPIGRLTQSTKYVYDKVLSIFGTDIKKNIELLITFCDGEEPPVLQAVRDYDVPFNGHFKFNNSAIYANNLQAGGQAADFNYMFWKLGQQSMEDFFNRFANLPARSLCLSKEVIDERERLETTAENLHIKIKEGLLERENIIKLENSLRLHEDQINSNRDFEIEVHISKMVEEKLKPGQYVTNCLTCNMTCHYLCAYSRDEDKVKCCAMDRNGFCRQCQGKCYWDKHRNFPYRLVLVQETKKEKKQEILERYNVAKNKKDKAETLVKNVGLHIEALMNEVLTHIRQMRQCLKRLDEIALRPNPLSTVEYIELLIQSEQHEGKPGFQSRIECLKNMKKKAELIEQCQDENFNPFEDFVEQRREEEKSLLKKLWTKVANRRS